MCPCRYGRRGRAATPSSAAYRAPDPASHGTATTSTKVSASSLRHTGTAPAAVVASRASPPAATSPRWTSGRPAHRRRRTRTRPAAAPRPARWRAGGHAARAEHRHDPTPLPRGPAPAAAARAGRCRSLIAILVERGSFTGGRPRYGCPSSPSSGSPTGPDQPAVRHAAARRGHPGVAQEGPAADLGTPNPHPAATSSYGEVG